MKKRIGSTMTLGILLPSVMALAACRMERAVSMADINEVSSSTHGGSAPSVALSGAGHRAISWVAPASAGETGNRLYVSVDGEKPTALIDSLGAMQAHAEAPPQLAFDRGGMLYVVYVVTRDAGKRFPESALRMAHSLDNGKSWTPPVTVTDEPNAFGAHNFHSVTIAPDGRVYVSWLDGRSGAMESYFASSSNGGMTWSKNSKLSTGETCPCCHTSIAAGKDGSVYAAWRAVFPGNVRDIVVARSTDQGVTWGTPVRVHDDAWVYDGCPHAGPSVRVDSLGRVHVLWWTGSPKAGGVWFASSTDGAKTFSPPIAIAPQRVPTPTHVQLGVDADNDVVAVWDDMHDASSVVTIRVSKDGGHTFGRGFAVSDSARNAMHPVLSVNDNAAYVVWTQENGGRRSSVQPAPKHGHGASMSHDHPSAATGVFVRDVRF